MRLIYFAIPFVAVLLVACGDDERDTGLPTAPATNDYELSDEPAPMPPAGNVTTPPRTDNNTGLGSERGTVGDEMADPTTDQGTNSMQ